MLTLVKSECLFVLFGSLACCRDGLLTRYNMFFNSSNIYLCFQLTKYLWSYGMRMATWLGVCPCVRYTYLYNYGLHILTTTYMKSIPVWYASESSAAIFCCKIGCIYMYFTFEHFLFCKFVLRKICLHGFRCRWSSWLRTSNLLHICQSLL